MKKYIITFFLALILSGITLTSFSQEFEQKEFSLSPSDTTRPDSASVDTIMKRARADSVIYSAEYIEYAVKKNVLQLVGNAEIKYQDMKLKADTVLYNSETRDVLAKGTPVLWDRGDKLVGDILIYNMDSKKGTILSALTKFDKGFYKGDTLKKVGRKTLKVHHGRYTTCNLEAPHYYFYGRRMKIYNKDKVIVKPVVMYIGEVPLVYIPFWIFPIKPGRHSGLLVPLIGFETFFDEGMERYFERLGYYWAINEYSDATISADYGEKRGWKFHLQGRYKLRYALDGDLHVRYERRPLSAGGVRTDWDFRLNHSHKIDETTSLRADAHFVTSKNILTESDEIDDRLQNVIESNIFLTKRWNSASMNMAYNERRDLLNDVTTRTMPSISLSFRQFPVIPVGTDENWWREIRGRFSSNFKNYRKNQNDEEDIDYISMNHSLGISYSTKLGFMNVTPSISYRETWKSDVYPHKSINMSFFSLSTSTKIYGIFNPNFWGINSIRHTVTPRLSYNPFPSYSYNADGMIFPLMNWNYELENETRNKNMPISLGNIFEAKLEKDSDAKADSVSNQSSQDFRKVELFRLDFSSSYDFDKEEKPFGNLSSTFRTKPFRNLSIDVNTTHDVYDWELLRLNFSTGFSVSGNLGEVDTLYTRGEREERDQHELGLAGRTLEEDTYFERGEWDLTTGVGTRRWSLSMDYHYNRGKDPESAVSNINISAKIQPTQNWSLSYRAYYDVNEKEITRQSYNITRNLHCWEASLNWQRYGDYWNYYVIFRIKELPDIKVEHRERSTP